MTVGLTLVLVFARADLLRATRLVVSIGPLAVLGLLPYALLVTCEALGWRALFRSLGRVVALRALLPARIVGVALTATLPAGTLAAEALKPMFLARVASVPAATTVASLTGSRILLITTHATYLAIAAVVGWTALSEVGIRLAGSPALPWVLVTSAVALFAVAAAGYALLARGRGLSRLRSFLERFSGPRSRRFFAARRVACSAADEQLTLLTRAPLASHLSAFVPYFASWWCEALESFVLLALLGVRLRFSEAVGVEALVSVVRALSFALPGGLGATDAAYGAALSGLGVHDPVSTALAFVALKRGKELAWACAATLILAATRRTASAESGLAVSGRLRGH